MGDATFWGLIVVGLIGLGVGGELVVRGGVGAARRLGVSPLIVGVVLMGFGTSLPELVTSVRSVLGDAPDIAVGNVVGSNIANLLLIAGVAAVLSGVASDRKLLSRDAPALALATVMLAAALWLDWLTPLIGGLFAAVLVAYLWLAVQGEAASGPEDAPPPIEQASAPSLPNSFLLFGLGLLATLFGADTLVSGASGLAAAAGLSEALIGATIVAVGTSLPELAATVAAALRGRADLAIGNVFGSNIFNSLAIMTSAMWAAPFATATLRPPPTTMAVDVWVMLGATALVILFARSDRRLSRREGAVLLALYVAFLGAAVWANSAI